MFDKWLDLKEDSATWDQLLNAIRNIGLPLLADNLQRKLLRDSKLLYM